MFQISTILSVSIVHLLAVMSPGPDFIVVIKNALNYSRKIGIYTALGIGLGIIIHIAYTFLGIGLLIKESPTLYQAIKILGALYILYMGVMAIVSNSKTKVIEQNTARKQSISKAKAFQIGFITNALNPKASLFFLSVFTIILPQDTNISTLIFIGVLLVAQTTLWFVLVSYFFTQKIIQKKYYQLENGINKLFGILLILLAVRLVF